MAITSPGKSDLIPIMRSPAITDHYLVMQCRHQQIPGTVGAMTKRMAVHEEGLLKEVLCDGALEFPGSDSEKMEYQQSTRPDMERRRSSKSVTFSRQGICFVTSTAFARTPLPASPQTLSQVIAANLTAALAVAGAADEYGQPRRFKSTQLQRETKIARSTLRTLKTYSTTREVNPDLQTLNRIAQALGIPVAFLLFGSNEWQALLRAVDDMALMLVAAEKLEEEASLAGPQAAVHILRKLKVYPFHAPSQTGASEPQQQALDQRNESRRRTTLVAAALAQAAARDKKSHKRLTALAASLANQTAAC